MSASPSRPRGHLKKAVLLALLLILAAAGGLWLSGQVLFGQAASLLGFNDGRYRTRAGVILAVPVVNIVWGRNISVTREGDNGPAALKIGAVYGRKLKVADGSAWKMELKDMSCGRTGAWLARAGAFRLQAAYRASNREVSFSQGGFDGLEFQSGEKYALRGGLKSFSFDRLAFAAGLAGGPLDWNVRIENLKAAEVRAEAAVGERSHALRPFDLLFNGHVSGDDWSVDLSLVHLEDGAEAAGPGADETEEEGWLAGLWSKAKDKFNPKEVFDFGRFRLEAAGPWRSGEGDGRARSSWTLDFPNLYELVMDGESEAPEKTEAAAWLSGCFKRLTDSAAEPRPDCLGALSFSGLKSHYEDRQAMSLMDRLKNFYDRTASALRARFGRDDSYERYALPLLGIDLTRWLLSNDYPQGSEGEFTFDSGGRPLNPFTEEFHQELSAGNLKLEFAPKD